MNSPKNGEGELDLVHLGMNGKLPWEKETFKGLSRVPNQLHEPGESFPASFLIFHSLSPRLFPCALSMHSSGPQHFGPATGTCSRVLFFC